MGWRTEFERIDHAGEILINLFLGVARDLKRFVTDISTSERLAPLVPAGTTLVSESGINGPADIARLRSAGIHAFLVGEHLMRQSDVAAATRELLGGAQVGAGVA